LYPDLKVAAPPDFSLTPAAFQVLVSLAPGARHGYAVMQDVEGFTDGAVRLGPGTLYRTIGRLVADGLIEETGGSEPDAPHDARRRRYQLTSLGREVAEQEAESMARLVDHARTVGLLRSVRT
jgi:DNA-binding PadR family transcriptional regulator